MWNPDLKIKNDKYKRRMGEGTRRREEGEERERVMGRQIDQSTLYICMIK
jgi:hypothetical protein